MRTYRLIVNMMQHRPKKVINRSMAATSVVRLIEVMKPKEPDQSPLVIVKPKPTKRRLPGAKLLRKLAQERQKTKAHKKSREIAAREIDMAEVDKALDAIMRDLS